MILAKQEIKAAIGTALLPNGTADLLNGVQGAGWIVDGSKEFEVAAVAGIHQFRQGRQAEDAFTDGCHLETGGAVAVFHLPVVFEKGHIIGKGFDAQHAAELVVDFQAGGAHEVAQAMSFDAGGELGAKFSFVTGVEGFAEEHGKGVWSDGMREGADDFLVDRSQDIVRFEDDVGGALQLHDAPVHAGREYADDGAVAPGGLFHVAVDEGWIAGIGQGLCFGKIADVHKGVLDLGEGNAGLGHATRQPVVPVAVELKAEGRPGGHAQIAESQVRIDEVKIVVDTASGIVAEKGAMGEFVMPGLEGVAGLHGREDMHQSGMFTAFGQNLGDAVFLAERIDLSDKLDLNAGFVGNRFGMRADALPIGFGPFREIEDAQVMGEEPLRHGVGMSNVRQGSLDNDSVETRIDSENIFGMSFKKRCLHSEPPCWEAVVSKKYHPA